MIPALFGQWELEQSHPRLGVVEESVRVLMAVGSRID